MAVLILDIGGVVHRSWPDDAFHRRWAQRCGCKPDELKERLWGGTHWGAAEKGQMTSDECVAICASRAGVDSSLVRTMVFEAFASQPDEVLARFVEGLRLRGVVVVALANNTSSEAELLARPELKRLFDRAISSADAGLGKPDAAFYRYAEAQLNTDSRSLVFVDDVAANVDAARALGWRGIVFQSTERTIDEIETALAQVDQQPASR